METKVSLVIHAEHGGFSLTEEIVERLRSRGVSWLDRLGDAGGRWYLPADGDDLRGDPDLVDIVREISAEVRSASVDLDWRARETLERRLLHGLRVADVTVLIVVEDDDGLERVRVTGGVW